MIKSRNRFRVEDIMGSELQFKTLEEFIGGLRKADIKKAVFTLIDEKRAVEMGEGMIQVLPVKRLEVLAYREAVIYRYVEEGDVDFDSVYRKLEDEGFELVTIDRNLL